MKKVVSLILVLLFAFTSVAAFAEWPEKNITVVIPASPGGDTDTTSRAICESLTQILGVPVTVSNVTGGAGIVAWNEVQSQPADGYTVLYHHVDTVLHNLLNRLDHPWDEDIEVSAVTGGGATSCIVTHKNSPFETFEDMVNYAKENPGKVSFAMETGGVVHMHIYALENALDVDFNEVDLGSAATRNTALLGGQVDLVEASYGQIIDYLTTGDMKVLALMADERNPNFPDVPAITEYNCSVVNDWWYYFGFRKGTDPAIVEKFTAAVEEAVKMEPYQNALGIYYYTDHFMAGQDAVDYMKRTEEFYRPVAEQMLASLGG